MGILKKLFEKRRWVLAHTGKYLCAKCGAEMEFEDELEMVLVCPECGHNVTVNQFACDDEEDPYSTIYGDDDDDIIEIPIDSRYDDEDYCGEYYDPEIEE